MPFDDFMEQLSTTNSTLDFFVDFDKVSKNVEKLAIKLNQLNYLIGKNDIAQAVKELYKENKDNMHYWSCMQHRGNACKNDKSRYECM